MRIEVETTSLCNRKCTYCPNSTFDKSDTRDSIYMSDFLLDRLLHQLQDISFTGTFAPHMYGEPLLDPRLPEIISLTKGLGMSPKLVTNADYLTPSLLSTLLDNGLEILYISKHSSSLSAGAREAIQLFEKRLENIHSFKILDFYSDYRSQQTMFGNRAGQISLSVKKKPPQMCPYVRYPVVDVIGNIVLCCQDFSSKHILGNIADRHLWDIWNDPSNLLLRKKIFRGEFDLKICQSCEME